MRTLQRSFSVFLLSAVACASRPIAVGPDAGPGAAPRVPVQVESADPASPVGESVESYLDSAWRQRRLPARRFRPQYVVAAETAQEEKKSETELDTAALAKQTQNPLADLISLPFQNNTDFGIGPNDQTRNTTNIQPVVPFALGENALLITRTILPVIYQPDIAAGSGGDWGLGDTTFTAFYSPLKEGQKVTWGVGPVIVLPTATGSEFGLGEWGLGASAVVLTQPGNWVVGALISNTWSVESSNLNVMLFQYFINYNLPDGWYLSSAPILLADWNAPSGDRWTVPFGGGGGKIFAIGKQKMNAQIQVFYNVESPAGGPNWQLRVQLQFLFPK